MFIRIDVYQGTRFINTKLIVEVIPKLRGEAEITMLRVTNGYTQTYRLSADEHANVMKVLEKEEGFL